MKLTISLVSILLPMAAFASDEEGLEMLTESSESSTESSVDSSQSQEIKVAGAVKRDAQIYLAGADMSRLLESRLAEIATERPELETDELIDYALAMAVATLGEVDTVTTPD